ncbi:MAG: acetamidase/formamidase family protein [Acidobacteriaceae bacterium]|nr:acetamidase/formamidase family protein [Acidobacteriaceae bacterium]MBV9764245.1 acetamidase/formamidase family protein [Acidobacteriaceae bacterium]
MKLSVLFFCLAVGPLCAVDLSGTWELSISGGQISEARRIKITSQDGKYKWTLFSSEMAGTPEGDRIDFHRVGDGKPCSDLKGRITDASMGGEGTIEGIGVKWSARRPVVRPSDAPTRHDFTPTVFYREFSGAKEPVLHIFPGDTVHTETVDAGGRDSRGVHRVFGGNPLTGPFYIEGAMPGDALVVKFTRVRLNRDSAQSGDSVIGSALDPYYFRDQAKVEHFDSEWKLDLEKQTGALKNPTDRLKSYKGFASAHDRLPRGRASCYSIFPCRVSR